MTTSTQKKTAAEAVPAKNAPVAEIARINAQTIVVPIVGTTPLIVNRFSEKAKQQMLDKMLGIRRPKENKDPQADYLAAFYRFKEDDDPEIAETGFPVIGFKASTVSSARLYDKSVTMVGLRQVLFFRGEVGVDGLQLARIHGTPYRREDVVRVGMGGTDLRYRPCYPEWSSELTIVYVTSALTLNSVLSLIDAAGMAVGVGEWRTEKSGDSGCFMVDPTRDVQVIS